MTLCMSKGNTMAAVPGPALMLLRSIGAALVFVATGALRGEALLPPPEARKRMARTPVGASLIPNPVSKAPGFRMDNVFVMAGIPRVMHVMLEGALPLLEGGARMLSRSIGVFLPEGRFGTALAELQTRFADVAIGSYPFARDGKYGASLVLRSPHPPRLDAAAEAVRVMLIGIGGEPFDEESA